MNSCSNLYYLSTIACQLAKCLDKDDLAVLAADLVVLSDMLANILVRIDDTCETKTEQKEETGVCETTSVQKEKTDAVKKGKPSGFS